MSRSTSSERGFTLIASLLLLFIISALAASMVYLVNSEHNIGGADAENSLAFYGAEAGMEQMMSDLGTLYTVEQSPLVSSITALQNNAPTVTGISYKEYLFNVPTNTNGTPISTTRNISTGPYAGLVAQIVPMTLQVTAERPLGQQVRMLRNIEVALIPVFQFGVFSDSNLSYFAGPTFDFAGRVHTNQNLFVAGKAQLTFHDKITAVGQVVRQQLPNTNPTSTNGYTANVMIPTAPKGCDGSAPACRNMALTEGSVTAGVTSTATPGWTTISTVTYNSMIINGATGAKPLVLPFVSPGIAPIQIIRQPPAGEDPTSAVGQSRLYNQAQVRVLLADTAAELPGGAGDTQNVPLANGVAGSFSQNGIVVSSVSSTATYLATGDTTVDSDWVYPKGVSSGQWPLINGFVRVERRNLDGTYSPVTQEWLGYGFARGLNTPNSELARTNDVHPNAILVLQMLADHTGSGVPTGPGSDATTAACPSTLPSNFVGSSNKTCWYPINFYDAREGEVRDNSPGDSSCTIVGIMNAVEIDVKNLRQWFLKTGAYASGTGNLTDNQSQNGYILYFSDRRGNIASPNVTPNAKLGEFGWEDDVNPNSSTGVPNGGSPDSGEDVNGNGLLDNYGAANLGDGFGSTFYVSGTTPNPYLPRMANCTTTARKNRVIGARHVLKLVNGSLGNLPTFTGGTGGFTVASEQPVYIQGDYNALSTGWGTGNAPAAVIADALTLLSNNWNDYASFKYPTQRGSRPSTTTYFRLAIAAGKNMTFNWPSTLSPAAPVDYGTDGGLHNFLRYLEDWSSASSWYQGSLVSFYYSQYATGVFKCCNLVYNAPQRHYSFDTNFLDPSQLPPGTPHFESVVNVGYRQDFSVATTH